MGLFGITRNEMERAIGRECSNKAKELEATVRSIDNRVERLESDAKHIAEHETKIDKLEKQFKELDEKLDKKFDAVNEKFDNLENKFSEVINDTRRYVDGQVDKAITQLTSADNRWDKANTKLQTGMDDLNKNMGELVVTVKGLVERTTTLEQAPAQQALEEKKTMKKEMTKRVFDALWKLFLAGTAALLAAKGINLF